MPLSATRYFYSCIINLKAELNPICHLLALVAVYHILHVSRVRVKELPSLFGSVGMKGKWKKRKENPTTIAHIICT